MTCNNTLLKKDVLFALGYTNGKISLNCFESFSNFLAGKEFSPKSPRPCNSLDFNPTDNNLVSFVELIKLFIKLNFNSLHLVLINRAMIAV